MQAADHAQCREIVECDYCRELVLCCKESLGQKDAVVIGGKGIDLPWKLADQCGVQFDMSLGGITLYAFPSWLAIEQFLRTTYYGDFAMPQLMKVLERKIASSVVVH